MELFFCFNAFCLEDKCSHRGARFLGSIRLTHHCSNLPLALRKTAHSPSMEVWLDFRRIPHRQHPRILARLATGHQNARKRQFGIVLISGRHLSFRNPFDRLSSDNKEFIAISIQVFSWGGGFLGQHGISVVFSKRPTDSWSCLTGFRFS